MKQLPLVRISNSKLIADDQVLPVENLVINVQIFENGFDVSSHNRNQVAVLAKKRKFFYALEGQVTAEFTDG